MDKLEFMDKMCDIEECPYWSFDNYSNCTGATDRYKTCDLRLKIYKLQKVVTTWDALSDRRDRLSEEHMIKLKRDCPSADYIDDAVFEYNDKPYVCRNRKFISYVKIVDFINDNIGLDSKIFIYSIVPVQQFDEDLVPYLAWYYLRCCVVERYK